MTNFLKKLLINSKPLKMFLELFFSVLCFAVIRYVDRFNVYTIQRINIAINTSAYQLWCLLCLFLSYQSACSNMYCNIFFPAPVEILLACFYFYNIALPINEVCLSSIPYNNRKVITYV